MKENGIYDFQFRVASNSLTNPNISITVNNIEVISNLVINPTGDWQKWKTISVTNIPLTKGIQVLKVNFLKGNINLNYLDINTHVPTGIEDVDFKSGWSIYPNPAFEKITVSNHQNDIKGSLIEVLNGVGGLVLKYNCTSNENVIDVSTIISGAYMLKITKDNKSNFVKFIKL